MWAIAQVGKPGPYIYCQHPAGIVDRVAANAIAAMACTRGACDGCSPPERCGRAHVFGSGLSNLRSITMRKRRTRHAASCISRERIPTSMLRSNAASVRLAEVPARPAARRCADDASSRHAPVVAEGQSRNWWVITMFGLITQTSTVELRRAPTTATSDPRSRCRSLGPGVEEPRSRSVGRCA